MHYSTNQYTAPAVEPLSPEEVKLDRRITDPAEDDYINMLIVAARQKAESYLSRQLINATWDLYLDRFPCGRTPIRLPFGKVSSVTSIVYTDAAGDEQTWLASQYTADVFAEPARILPKSTTYYPVTANEPNAVRVRYVAGYCATADSVPAMVKKAMLLMIGAWWEYREDMTTLQLRELPISSCNALDPFRVGDDFHIYGQLPVGAM